VYPKCTACGGSTSRLSLGISPVNANRSEWNIHIAPRPKPVSTNKALMMRTGTGLRNNHAIAAAARFARANGEGEDRSENSATWWRNLRDGAEVDLLLAGV
jgi:hypothetical protein